MVQTPRGLSQSINFSLMSVDFCKMFKTIILTHSNNFVSLNIALTLFPEGPDVPDPQVPLPVTQLHPDVRGHLKSVPFYYSYSSL